MAGISLQRWDESTYSAAFAFVADMRLWHHILPETERWRCWESVKQERPCKKKKKKGRGSECIVLWHMDWALNYCQSSCSQRLRISHEELCMVKMFGVQRERQLIRPNVHMHRYGNHRSELLKSNFTTCFSPDASDPTAEAHVRRCSYPSSVARKSELADGSTDPWQDFPSRN